MLQSSTDSLHNQANARVTHPPFLSHPATEAGGVARRVQPEPEPGAPGLSTSHISPLASPLFGSATFFAGGSLIQVKKPRRKLPQVGGGRRGCVRLFSKASRRRMLQLLGKILHSFLPLFVTLTYPGVWWPSSPLEWKRHFDLLDKRLARRWPKSALIWKLEPQARGAPHFHMLVWHIPFSELREWLPEAWNEVVYGSKVSPALRESVELYRKIQRRGGTEAASHAIEASGQDLGRVHHILAGVGVEIIRTWRGVRRYSAKYMGKVIEDSTWEAPGRWWGVRRPDNVPWAHVVTADVSHPQACKLIRLMRRYARLKGRDYPGLSILTNDATFWFERLDRLLAFSP